jgi:multiple sugar transport system substrate-binding protein
MRTPRLYLVLICALLVPLLAACGGAAQVSLSYAFPDDAASRAAAEALMMGFAAQAPGVTLSLEPLPVDTYAQTLLDRIGAGTGPDLFSAADAQLPALQGSAALLDLSPLGVTPAGAPDVAVAPWRAEGKLFGLPQHAVPQMLFYNRSLFDAAGAVYPSERWSWDEWRATARQLSNRTSGVFGTSVGGWLALVLGNGGSILNPERTATMLDQPPAVEGVQFGADMINVDGSAPLPQYVGGPDPVQLFREGKLAMLPAPSSLIGTLQKEAPAFAWDIAPLPTRAGQVTALAVTGLSASAKTAHPQQAADFIKWAAGPEGVAAAVQAFPFAAPALPSVAPADMLKGAGGPAGGKFVLEALNYGRVPPYVKPWPEITRLVNASLEPVWKGERTAAAAYLSVAPQINALLQA